MSFIGRFGFRTGRDINKFEQVKYRTGTTGAPIVLDNTIAFLEAELTHSIDVGSHTLFIGRVISCETLDDSAYPMTYAYYRDVSTAERLNRRQRISRPNQHKLKR